MKFRRIAFSMAALLTGTTSFAGDLRLTGVSLLQPEQVVGARVDSAPELATYVQALEKTAVAYFATLQPATPRAGHLVIATKPVHATSAWVVFEPALPAAQADALIRRLRDVPPVDTKDGPVVFALAVSIDGAAAPTEPVPVIEEWSTAAQKAGKALSIDEVVLSTWKP
jgi:hypothetical protein